MSASPAAKATTVRDPQLTERIAALRDGLVTGLVERDVPIRLALLSVLAGEHLLLIGPPGTAKSLIARRLHAAFADGAWFERLLTRFTVPEELFGPLSIKGLEEDRYQRLTTGYLPSATVAFLDEIFKANSAILNALLTLLNERRFDNGTDRLSSPLRAVIGASNELPEGPELAALYDRFLLRLHVGPVSTDAFPELLQLRGALPCVVDPALALTPGDLDQVQQAAVEIAVPDDVLQLLTELRAWTLAEQIPVSDRRWRKIVKLLQVSALSNGRDAVSIWDCWLLQHCTWGDPADRERVYDWYAERVGASAAMDPTSLTRLVVVWEGQLRADQESRTQARDVKGSPVYIALNGKGRTTNTSQLGQAHRDGEPLFLAPAQAEEHTGRSWSRIEDRSRGASGYTRAELSELRINLNDYYNTPSFDDWNDRDSYLATKANWLMADQPLKPLLEPTRHKPAYLRDCLAQLASLDADVAAYQDSLQAHIASLERDIRTHLWVTPDFVEPASESLDQTRQTVASLRTRVGRLTKGFELLPREVEPAPVRTKGRGREK